MKTNKLLIFLFLSFSLSCKAFEKNHTAHKDTSSEYCYNETISLDLWNELKPYFLPFHHPIKKKLDLLFTAFDPLESIESFMNAGFALPHIRTPQHLVIGKHPDLHGYLIKFYFDEQPIENEWGNFLSRIKGALSIKEAIETHGFHKRFAVPQKWLYPLPKKSQNTYLYPKNFILVVEDMHILSHAANHKAYHEYISKKYLKELFTLIDEIELIDSIYIGNIPFNHRQQICFVDTEWHHAGSVNFPVLSRYLNPKMQAYWHSLINANANLSQ